jgi:putative effector of murein hydrolase LrgA (UPF0299 family)
MRGALAAGGTAVAAALCCLAIPLTVGIIGVSGLAAFGANLAVVAILASGLIVVLILRSRSRRAADGSGDGNG